MIDSFHSAWVRNEGVRVRIVRKRRPNIQTKGGRCYLNKKQKNKTEGHEGQRHTIMRQMIKVRFGGRVSGARVLPAPPPMSPRRPGCQGLTAGWLFSCFRTTPNIDVMASCPTGRQKKEGKKSSL